MQTPLGSSHGSRGSQIEPVLLIKNELVCHRATDLLAAEENVLSVGCGLSRCAVLPSLRLPRRGRARSFAEIPPVTLPPSSFTQRSTNSETKHFDWVSATATAAIRNAARLKHAGSQLYFSGSNEIFQRPFQFCEDVLGPLNDS